MQLELFNNVYPAVAVVKKSRTTAIYSDLPFFDVARNDNEVMLNMQYRYLMFNDKKAYTVMWVLAQKLCGKFVHKEMKKHNLHFDKDYFEDLVINAVEYVLRRYTTTPGYYVKQSFTSELYNGVRHALWYRGQSEIVMQQAIQLMNEREGISLDAALLIAKESYKKSEKQKRLAKKSNNNINAGNNNQLNLEHIHECTEQETTQPDEKLVCDTERTSAGS